MHLRGRCDERLVDVDFLLLSAANHPVDAIDRASAVLARAGSVERRLAAEPAALDAALQAVQGRTLVLTGDDRFLRQVLARGWRKHLLDDLQIGLVPLGVAGLAQHLGLPDRVEAAAQRIIDGSPRRLDLLRDDQAQVVVNAAYVGPVVDRPQGTVRRLVRALHPATVPLRVEVDDQVLADFDPVAAVLVGNGPGALPDVRVPDACVDDGLLDVLVVGVSSRSAPKGPTGQQFRPVRRARGRAVNVYRQPADEVSAMADGEHAALRERRCWWVLPQAWTVID